MGKKRSRIINPEPFAAAVDDAADDYQSTVVSTKRRSKASKVHQLEDKVIPKGVSSKILKEALIQQKEIEEEETDELNAGNPNNIRVSDWNSVTESVAKEIVDEEGDIDEFQGFSETQSQYGGVEEELDEDDERLLDAFFSTENQQQQTLADIIAKKIKEKDAHVSSEVRPVPKLDTAIVELYKGVGKLLSKYTSGKIPKAFKHIPSLQLWEEVVYLTEPEKWSPNAMFQATRIFASNMGVKKAERFYKFVLLPRVREDIRKNKRLHFALYQSLKKALYKPGAFNKGILFPLCESRTCTLREAVVVGSIIEKISIPPLHSSVALLKLAEMEYCGTTSYFIKLLIEKKYALPYRVLDAMVDHFMRFREDSRIMPVIWHQSLLAFAQRYKTELTKQDKADLNFLVGRQRHRLVTPEILRELNNSRNRGEKEDDLMALSAPVSVNYKVDEKDRDIPEVPMEED